MNAINPKIQFQDNHHNYVAHWWKGYLKALRIKWKVYRKQAGQLSRYLNAALKMHFTPNFIHHRPILLCILATKRKWYLFP